MPGHGRLAFAARLASLPSAPPLAVKLVDVGEDERSIPIAVEIASDVKNTKNIGDQARRGPSKKRRRWPFRRLFGSWTPDKSTVLSTGTRVTVMSVTTTDHNNSDVDKGVVRRRSTCRQRRRLRRRSACGRRYSSGSCGASYGRRRCRHQFPFPSNMRAYQS